MDNSPNEMMKLQSQTISWLRFPLIILVVFTHNQQLAVDGPYPLITQDTISITLLSEYFRICISRVIQAAAVPCFFVISGYFFFFKTPELTKNIYRGKLKKRFFSLFVPYIIWNLIPLIINIGTKAIMPLTHRQTWGGYLKQINEQIDQHGLLNIFWEWYYTGGYYPNWLGQYVLSSYPYNFPLWYMRDLIVACILSPILYFLIKRTGKWFIFILVVMYFGNISSPIPGTGTTTLLFFSIGAYLAINRKNIVIEARKIGRYCYVFTIVFILMATYFSGQRSEIGHYFICGYVLTSIVSFFKLASYLVETKRVKVNRVLTSSVFFIYVFHTNWFVSLYDRVLHKFCTIIGLDPINIITYVTTPFVKVGICIIVFVLIERYMPKMGRVLTGNR